MEPLTQKKIQEALESVPVVRKVVYLPVVSSTNDVARALAKDGAPDFTVIVADEQTAGRGRLGRAWWAPAGACLLMSVLHRPNLRAVQAMRLTMVGGVAAAEAIEEVAHIPTQLKWPNDIWISNKKGGGVLTETALTGERLDYAIVGIGLNINVDFAGKPELNGSATSLMMEVKRPVDRLSVLGALVQRFSAWSSEILSARLKASWAARLVTLGQPVIAQLGEKQIHGLAEAVDDDGTLLVRSDDGILHRLRHGDVSLRHRVGLHTGNPLHPHLR
jgi:BirA family transcriptional regulator, biotin operon repressor / biotin---[acetyl-CoA-carboxylase] ligase